MLYIVRGENETDDVSNSIFSSTPCPKTTSNLRGNAKESNKRITNPRSFRDLMNSDTGTLFD